MSMSKQQIVGIGLGGVFLVAAGALGYLLFDAATARSEAEENLADATGRFTQYNEAPVFASAKSIASVKSNETSYATWRKSAMELVSRGDMLPPPDEEPSVFKQRLQTEVRRMGSLPGGVSGHIAAPEFLFGFEQYLGESGVLPQQADVPGLAIQMDAISRVVDMLAKAGALEVKAITRIAPKASDDDDASNDGPQKKKKGKNKAKKQKAVKDDAPQQTCREYAFDIVVRPASVVEILNMLSSDARFMVVKNLSLHEMTDTIITRMSAKETAESQAAAPAGGGSRRRRRGAASFAEAEGNKAAEGKVDRLVVDPETDVSIQMTFTLAVYDFGTAAAPTEKAGSDDAAPQPQQSTSKKEEK